MGSWGEIPRPNTTTSILCFILMSILLISVIISRWRNWKVIKFMASIPGPISVPFLGAVYCLLDVRSENLFHFVKAQLDRYPKIGGYWVAGAPYVYTTDKNIFNAILNSSENVQKIRDYDHFKANSRGLFVTNGPVWRKMRKLINPSFKSNVLASFGENFRSHSKIFMETLQRHAADEKEFDVFVPAHLCAIDFLCENMMGCQMDVQWKNLTHLSHNLMKSTEMIFERSFSVLQWSDLIYSLIGKQRTLDETTSGLRAFAREMLERQIERRKELRNLNLEAGDHVQNFMEILLNNLETGNMTLDRAIEEATEMIIAGSITTATTIAWILKIVAMRPDIQKEAYHELLETCETSRRNEINLEDLSKLTYLDMVVKEALRHFAVPFVGRHIVRDVKVDEKTTIPVGVQVLMVIFGLHHDPEHWEKPGEFYPEHFLPKNEMNRSKGTFAPFLSGPRVCPGNKYGMQSMKFLLANTILKYEFTTDEVPPKDFRDENYRIIYMLHPTSGFRVRVNRRPKTQITQTGLACGNKLKISEFDIIRAAKYSRK